MTLRRFRQALGGMIVDADGLPVESRSYELAKRFGWTLTEIDEQPAARVDWLLEMARVEDSVRAEEKPTP